MRNRLLLVGLLLTLLTRVPAQTKETTSSDVRIDKDRPNAFVSFHRQGSWKPTKRHESNARIWLRFNNNSKWSIGTCMWDVAAEYGDKEIPYEVERIRGGRGTVPVTTDPEGSCPVQFIEPGKSVIFSVPREHLSIGTAIKVQFRYEWETDSDGFMSEIEPKHYVYFYGADVPKK